MMLRRRAFFFSAFALLRADAFLLVPTSRCAISLPQSGLAPTCQNRFSQTSKIVLPHLDNTSLLSSALEASPAATVAAVAVAPPSLKAVALACAIPTLLGYYKSEYGVSYAYGTAVATVAYLTLRALPVSGVLPVPSAIAACHASAVFFYGIRLNLFLMYREIFVPRFAKMRERIEERAVKRGSRLARTPFILSCAVLYGCMTAPLLVMEKIYGNAPLLINGEDWPHLALLVSSVFTWLGFLLGAVGDLQKSYSKARNGDDHLVTGGVFSLFRHPNYTGEAIGWTANCAAAFVAVLSAGSGWVHWKDYLPYLAASLCGCMGICTVLSAATANLEQRQKDQYGDTEEYRTWMRGSWGGIFFKKKKSEKKANDAEENVDKVIELDVKDEAEGTGI
mmetsp:Transcript_100/g.200  ORF Transcript_100/g.200 Transcript_100/m.200 type:complete len:393 (-) Transcript_100:124-1302(-)